MNKSQMIDLTSSVIAFARAIADGSEEERECFPPEFVKKADDVAAAWSHVTKDLPEGDNEDA